MIHPVQPSQLPFPLLLQVPQPGCSPDQPTDVWLAQFRPGATPEEDQVYRLRPLADSSSDERCPLWAPGGRPAYVSEHGLPGVYLHGPGGEQPVVGRPGITSASCSPDAGEWAFVTHGPGGSQLFRKPEGGPARRVLLANLIPRAVVHAGDFLLVACGPGGLWRMDRRLDGSLGPPSRLGKSDCWDLGVSRDGARAALVQTALVEGNWGQGLVVRDLKDGRETLIAHGCREPQAYDWPEYRTPSFSPDGGRVFYSLWSWDGGPDTARGDLRCIPVTGGQPTVLQEEVLQVAAGA